MTEHSSALVGFAVLRANFNAEAPSYIDNFRGFVLGVLVEEHPKRLTQDKIAAEIRESFGIAIPDLVVGKILKRAKRTRLIEGEPSGYSLTQDGLKAAPAIKGMRDKYLRQQNELEDRFFEFTKAEFPLRPELQEAPAAEDLVKYLDRIAVPVIASAVRGRRLADLDSRTDDQSQDSEYVVARFVAHLHERDSVGFSYLEEFAKGAILASVVTLDTSTFRNSLATLSIYVDTPVLIDLLGYGGVPQALATSQLIDLARAQGATICAFEHSVRELDGVMQSAESFSRNTQGREARPIDLTFQELHWSAADIAIGRQMIPKRLQDLGIEVRSTPDGYRAYGLDEEALERHLQEVVHYRHESTRRYDVESISAIHRLRRGSSHGFLDRCGAVLLTNNTELVRASQLVEGERHDWPLAMSDSALAGILWARSPAVAQDLPRNMVVASAYAGMQPEAHLWARYVDEVKTLESRGEVSADEAVVLRATVAGKNALMEETLGLDARVNSDSPLAVLQRLRTEIEEPFHRELIVREGEEAAASASADSAAAAWLENEGEITRISAELDEQREEAQRLSSQLESLRDIERNRRTNIEAFAHRRAALLIKVALWVIVAPLVSLAGLKLIDPPWLAQLSPIVGWLAGACAALVAIFAILDSLGQGTVTQWLKSLERPLADRIRRKALSRAGLEV
ncbi:hypothetical protein [Sinomonas halotolerans]|uniref:Uncharacterized protein n=1 Tax=Sinomonas halotolerans TaxID=1644133 RepID=A0ABU9WYZ6_9MICC